jgi:membrane protease YdiL (CAAX protease family)
MGQTTSTLRPLPVGAALLWFGAFGLAMLATTRLVLPPLVRGGWHPHLAWFAAGMPVFLGMFVAVAVQLRRERSSWSLVDVAERLRVRRLGRGDVVPIAIALAVTGVATPALLALGFSPAPSFMHVGPLAPHERGVLLWWIPFFAANILGEELLWRGVLLPRQERAHGRHAWIVHGLGWLVFHIAFGPSMMLVTAPLMLAQSWACQRTGNTTVGIAIHGGVNGLGFVALAFVPM